MIPRRLLPQVGKERLFQFQRAFFRCESFFFVLFEFRGNVPLGVFERLLADEVVWNLFAGVGVGDFQIVPENARVPDFERADAGLLLHLRLIVRHPLFAGNGDVA